MLREWLQEGRAMSSTRVFAPADDQDADFFQTAPKEIGPVDSAHTSLSRQTRSIPLSRRFLRAALLSGGLAALVAVGLVVGARLPIADGIGLFFMFFVVVMPFALIPAFYTTRFDHYCGYVGSEGVAYFACKGSRDRVTARETLLYRDAAELRVVTTHEYLNGVYSQTVYAFSWTDTSGNSVFVINGKHHAEKKLPPVADKYHFALVAENGWSHHLLATGLSEIKRGGSFNFGLKGPDRICLRKDVLQLQLNGKTQDFSTQDLAECQIKGGVISLKEPGAKAGWLTSTGVHSISYADLANAKVFLSLLETQFGIAASE
jgi:hypothetical protein